MIMERDMQMFKNLIKQHTSQTNVEPTTSRQKFKNLIKQHTSQTEKSRDPEHASLRTL